MLVLLPAKGIGRLPPISPVPPLGTTTFRSVITPVGRWTHVLLAGRHSHYGSRGGRSSLSSALVVLTSGAAGDSDTPVGDGPASAGTRFRAVNQGGDQHGEGRHQRKFGRYAALLTSSAGGPIAAARTRGPARTCTPASLLGDAVGTNWWCTGFIAHLPCGLPSVRQLLDSGQVPGWVSLLATLGP
jgi:hypothetical protein